MLGVPREVPFVYSVFYVDPCHVVGDAQAVRTCMLLINNYIKKKYIHQRNKQISTSKLVYYTAINSYDIMYSINKYIVLQNIDDYY